eukprot:Partr_v1_DN27720_c0_g1_i1_m67574 putative PHD finger protein
MMKPPSRPEATLADVESQGDSQSPRRPRGRPRKHSLSSTAAARPKPLPDDSAVEAEEEAGDHNHREAGVKSREEMPLAEALPDFATAAPVSVQPTGGKWAVDRLEEIDRLGLFRDDLLPTADLPVAMACERLESVGRDLPRLELKHPLAVPQCSFSAVVPLTGVGSSGPFARPVQFLRHGDPSEDELRRCVEYDMDEQDLCWLKLYNHRERSSGGDTPHVPVEFYEKVVDVLEKEWFHLTKDIGVQSLDTPTHEESMCSICQDGEVDNSNAIVFCDGCNVAVHQECYGVPYIPEGQWLCRKCMVSPEKPVSCLFCPVEGGAFKQTSTNRWAHLMCSLWIPELFISNPVYMEPIEGVNLIPKSRWKLICSICRQKHGACIQCTKPTCFTAYHVTCARKAGLFMKSRHFLVGDEHQTSYRSFCVKHTPPAGGAGPHSTSDLALTGHDKSIVAQKVHRAKKKKRSIISLNAPVAPEILFDRVCSSLESEKWQVRKKKAVILAICKYWSLLRKSRRGIPLLKRLHLEPWTMYSSFIKQSESIQIKKYKILEYFRQDLETVRTLVDLTGKREREKLKHLKQMHSFIMMSLSPLAYIFSTALEELKSIDRAQYFWFPVSVADVPDYYDIIKNPMCFETIQQKIERFEYDSAEEFYADTLLITTNCLLYNKPETHYSKIAVKIRDRLQTLREQLEPVVSVAGSSIDIDDIKSLFDTSIPDALISEKPGLHVPVKHSVQHLSTSNKRAWNDLEMVVVSTPAEVKVGKKLKVAKVKLPALDADTENAIKAILARHQHAMNGNAQEKVSGLFWAKIEGFPWFPCELVSDLAESQVPQKVRSQQLPGTSLMHFLDRDLGNKRTW